MAQQRRSVRFMPMGGLSDSMDPAPVFSPTQMETHTSVLHSVFSPTAKQRQISPSTENQESVVSADPHHYHMSATHNSSQMLSRSEQGNEGTRFFGGLPSRSPSPRRFGSAKKLEVNTHSRGASPASTISNTVFYSPQSSLDMESPRSFVSGLTHKTSSSFRSLRDVTLLDVENIKKCNSVADLENVIEVLNGEGKFQALLRTAKNRLQAVLGHGTGTRTEGEATKRPTGNQSNNLPPELQRLQAPPTASSSARLPSPKQSATDIPQSPKNYFTINLDNPMSPRQQAISNARSEEMETTNDSSLIFSMSSSLLEANFDDNFDGQQQQPQQADALSASTRKFDRRRTGNQVYVSPSPSPTARYDRKLSEDLKKLTETVLSMDSARAADRKLFLEKLASLEHKKDDSVEKMKMMERMMEHSTGNTNDLVQSLEQLRAESQELQEIVRSERKVWSESYSHLCQQVDKLSTVLLSQPAQASKEQLKQYEAQIVKKQKEYETVLGKLLSGLGRNKNELSRMTQEQQHEIVDSFVQKAVDWKAATNGLAQTAATLEQERSAASRAKEEVSRQLRFSNKAQLRLEKEKYDLVVRCDQLNHEISQLQKQLKEMSSHRKPLNEDWQKKEALYKQQIKSLKNGMRKEGTMVNLDLYKAATESLKKVKSQCADLESQLKEKEQQSQLNAEVEIQKHQEKSQQRITELKSQLKVAQQDKNKAVDESERLQKQVSELQEYGRNSNGNPEKSPPPPPSRPRQPPAPRNISPMTPSRPTLVVKTNVENVPPSPGTAQKQLHRSKLSFVKEAGGRKGLQQRLQKIRSPKAQQTITMM